MEKVKRKPFQGVVNIIRFNLHFYGLVLLAVLLLLLSHYWIPENYHSHLHIMVGLVVTPVVVSLIISYYIYDHSDLYSFQWMETLRVEPHHSILNIHAGYDETSDILSMRFPKSILRVADFYDPEKNTEISIERARRAYPQFPGTQKIETTNIPFERESFDFIFLLFAAHEIRNDSERVNFLRQLRDTLTDEGRLIVMEHTRDWLNFAAYNIGFFHFWPKKVWARNFNEANLEMTRTLNHTSLISIYILKKNGIAA